MWMDSALRLCVVSIWISRLQAPNLLVSLDLPSQLINTLPEQVILGKIPSDLCYFDSLKLHSLKLYPVRFLFYYV